MAVVLITGGTGLIGKNLTRHLVSKGHSVIIMSRNPTEISNDPLITFAVWNIKEQVVDGNAIAKADYIITLAGAGVMDKYWTKKYKQEIVESRIKSNLLIIKGLRENKNKVKGIIAASAIGWYGDDADHSIKEKGFVETDDADENFLGDTCKLWEESIEAATDLNKRLVKFRIGIVLSNEGGALPEFKKSLKLGIAGIFGSGKQMVSWIHIDDLCRMFIHAMENENVIGTYNAVSILPVTNKKLMLKLGQSHRGSFFIPVHIPKFLLKLILGERSIEILKSTTVNNDKIKATGFTFLYPTVDTALKQLRSCRN